MIAVIADKRHQQAGELVTAALIRSVGSGLVPTAAVGNEPIILTIGDIQLESRPRSKRVHFGGLPPELWRLLDASEARPLEGRGFRAPPTPANNASESHFAVRYGAPALLLGGRRWRRPFARYDFTDEWNNLGYGAIVDAASPWGLGEPVLVAEQFELAAITDEGGQRLSSYAALLQAGDEALLWFNRPVGPIDSFEWRLVENFLSSFGSPNLPIVPVISEIPAGYDVLVCARLDCDEDIESARALWASYDAMHVPLSLGIHTALLDGGAVPALLLEASERPGVVLAHSATHPPNWGGSGRLAEAEASRSADVLERATGRRPKYAVSPFHQTPGYAIEGLVAAGFTGCIGGSISGDPAFNMARSGVPAGAPDGFVGVTGQCMLHGDSLLTSDPILRYRQAFELALQSASPFFYLDHPFSPRYRYGWASEGQRIQAHRHLIEHVSRRAMSPLFLSAGQAMDFVLQRAATIVRVKGGGYQVEAASGLDLQVSVEYGGKRHGVARRLDL